MSVNIRYPNITGLSEKEQLAQIKSYLHQLVEQLNYALQTLGTVGEASTYEAQGGGVSYYELQSMIIDATNKLKNKYERLYNRLENDYVLPFPQGCVLHIPGIRCGESGYVRHC